MVKALVHSPKATGKTSPKTTKAHARASMSKGQVSYMNRSLKQVCALLWELPDEVPLTIDRLEKAKLAKVVDDRMWNPAWQRMAQLPKPFIAAKLQQ